MKLIKLVIENIASIVKAEIDFGGDLLGREPLFLICGPTGAGKSTILDAISLALYNTTPRLSGAPAERFEDIAGGFHGADGGAEPVSTDDQRMLMRRGTTSCEIRLNFADDNGKEYTAVWSCCRSRRRPGGRMQQSQWQLLDADGSVICARKRDTEQELQRLTGLTFDQFCRTTMLAQGAFSRFLASSADEKSRILERLTGTSIYSEISMRIFQRFRSEEEKLRIIRERAGGITLLSDAETDALNERLRTLEQQSVALKSCETELNGKLSLIDARLKAEQQLSGDMEALASVENLRKSEPVVRQRDLVRDWDATAECRNLITRIHDEQRARATIISRLENRDAWYEAEAALVALTDNIDRCERNYEETTARINNRETFGTVIDKIDDIVRMTVRYRQLVSELDSLNNTNALGKKSVEKLEAEIDRSTGEIVSITEALDKKQRHLVELEEKELYRRLTDNEKKADALRVRITSLRNLYSAVSLLNDRDISQKRLEHLLEEAIAREVAGSVRVSEKNKELIVAEKNASDAELLYDRQSVALSDYLKALRSQLKTGDICPLCGTIIDSPADDQSFERLLEPLADNRKRAREEREVSAKQFAEANAELNSIGRERKNIEKLLSREREMVCESRKAVDSAPLSNTYLQQESSPDKILPLIETDISGADTELETVKKLTTAGRKIREDADVCRDEIQAINKRLIDAEKSIVNLKAALGEERARISGVRQQIDSVTGECMQLADAIIQLMPEGVFREMAISRDYPSLIESLRAEVDADKYDRRLLTQIEKQLTALRTTLDAVTPIAPEVRQMYDNVVPDQSHTHSGDPEKCVELWQNLLAEIRADRRALSDCDGRISELKNRLEENEKIPDAVSYARTLEVMGHAAEIESCRSTVEAIDRDCDIASARVNASRTALSDAINKLGDIPPGSRPEIEAERTVVIAQNEQMMRETGEITHRIRQDADMRIRYSRIMDEIAAQQTVTDRWGRLSDLFGSSDGKRMRTIAQSYILSELTVHANNYLRRLSRRYRLSCQPGQLTILVSDLEAGGELRPAVNLSGGESFVVSLALALGLPALSGKALAFDVIFIDEGFGTLDAETLSIVVETLGNLHSIGGRRVGLISHVESLQERIPVQIRVTPEGGGCSVITVVDAQ